MELRVLRPSAQGLVPDAFLEAKLHPPTTRSKWVPRARLLSALDRAAESPLTLVAAPAGYGKTTVAAQWISQLNTHSAVWVALDVGDNDPVRLWTHIATALDRAGCRIGDNISGLVAMHQSKIVTVVLPSIIRALGALDHRIVLILDDFHFVQAGACLEQIDYLIEHLPRSAGMMIITRADPALRLGRLRVSGQLAEIRADRLSFDDSEASSLFASEGVRLSDTSVAELIGRTEGWPAALYLATLSLAGRDDADAFVHRFSGDNHFIGDYLIEEVLSRQPATIRSFIISSSIFDRFCAPLCDYVLASSDAGARLRNLVRSNLFLVPLDPERKWFRFHHLFAAVARNQLEAEDADRAQRLHERAADWFARHDFADDAIRHAIAAGATARASQLVQANWVRYVDAGRAATVQGWLKALRIPEAGADPAALVTAAWIAVVTGDQESLTGLLDSLADVPDDAQLPDGTRSVESAVAILRGLPGFGGPVEMLSSAERAVELETDGNSPWFAFANLALGNALYISGDLEAAASVLPKAAYSGAATAIIRTLSFSLLSMMAAEEGRTETAAAHAAAAMKVVEEHSMQAMPQASMAFTALGESQAACGDLTGGMITLEEGLILRRKIPGLSPWPTIYHLLAMGRVATIVGDLGRAEQLLDEASQLMSRFPAGMEAMRARLSAARVTLRRRSAAEPVLEPLTGRELDVLRLLQSSLNLTEIASELYLSRNTVKTHAQAVYRKLGATSRSDAVRIGRRHSLI